MLGNWALGISKRIIGNRVEITHHLISDRVVLEMHKSRDSILLTLFWRGKITLRSRNQLMRQVYDTHQLLWVICKLIVSTITDELIISVGIRRREVCKFLCIWCWLGECTIETREIYSMSLLNPYSRLLNHLKVWLVERPSEKELELEHQISLLISMTTQGLLTRLSQRTVIL